MIFISHRGNLNGPNLELENSPQAINDALAAGYVVEVDVFEYRFGEDKFYLGHDEAQYEVTGQWMRSHQGLLCHAKDPTVLTALRGMGVHCFMHEDDPYVLTSRGWLISHCNNRDAVSGTVQMMPEFHEDLSDDHFDVCFGVCSDYIEAYKNRFIGEI